MLDVDAIQNNLGISKSLMDSFGVSSMLEDVKDIISQGQEDSEGGIFPPGSDELLALINLLDVNVPNSSDKFDYIVVDTAPSGHTVRMLNGPKFLDTALGKLLKFKGAVGNLMSKFQALGDGSGGAQDGAAAKWDLNKALDLIDSTQAKINKFTEAVSRGEVGFVVVAIPTKLSFEESRRVVSDINAINDGKSNVVKHIVVNQVLPDRLSSDEQASLNFFKRRANSHKVKIEELERELEGSNVHVHKVPYIDTEIIGAPGLSYLGDQHLSSDLLSASIFSPLEGKSDDADTKVLIFGGKGGVGKTTTSSAVAVRLMKMGHKVAVISTDPAHSLGDALGVELNGEGVDLTSYVYDSFQGGSLTGYEIDTLAAVEEFKSLLKGLTAPDAMKNAGVDVGDLASIFDTLPPGADEVIALAKVVELLRKGGYDRIVLDTAPTGHTLRMLTFPRYVDNVIEKAIKITDRVKDAAMLVSSSLKEEDIEKAKMKLLGYQLKMFELDELFSDTENCQFCIVCIPTDLAVKETVRLFKELKNGEVKVAVENIFVNQVAEQEEEKGDNVVVDAEVEGDDKGGGSSFVRNIMKGQGRILNDFKAFGEEEHIDIVRVDLLDEEPKGEYGLRALWSYYEP